jgi:hypothetical protein
VEGDVVILNDRTERGGLLVVSLNPLRTSVAVQASTLLSLDELYQLIGALNDAAEAMEREVLGD